MERKGERAIHFSVDPIVWARLTDLKRYYTYSQIGQIAYVVIYEIAGYSFVKNKHHFLFRMKGKCLLTFVTIGVQYLGKPKIYFSRKEIL